MYRGGISVYNKIFNFWVRNLGYGIMKEIIYAATKSIKEKEKRRRAEDMLNTQTINLRM